MGKSVADDGDLGVMRRAPRLWEQQLAATVNYVNPGGSGVASGPVSDGVLSDDTGVPDPSPVVPTVLPTPSAPKWRSGLAMIVVTWDGLDSTGQPWPVDTKSWVEAHVSPTANFTPSKVTNQGTFLQGAGDMPSTALKADTDYWIKLVGRDELGGMTVSAEVKAHTGLIMDTDIGKGVITPDKVSFDARDIGGVTTGIGTTLPAASTAKDGDIFLLKVTNPEGGVTALKQYQFSNGAWNPVEWGASALSAKCITAQQITAGSIVAGAIAADAVLARNIKAGEITADKIAVGTITAQSACIQSLDASKITVGSLSADRIQTGAMLADRIKGGTIQGATLRTPVGADGTQIVIGDVDGGLNSDYMQFLRGGDIKGQIKPQPDGLYIYGGGTGEPVVLTGPAGVRMDNIDKVTFNDAQHNVLGINTNNRIVQFTNIPKMDGEATGTQVDDLRALVHDLQAQVQALTGRLQELEAR